MEIGDNNVIREYCTIHRGTIGIHGRTSTVIGNNCMLMAYSHVAHDVMIQNNVILSNNVQVGGHVSIDDNAIIGGSTPIHQFCKIGKYSFIGGGLRIVQDIPPYIMAMGEPLRYSGINSIGLSRNNFTKEIIASIKRAYKIIYRSKFNVSQALKIIDKEFKEDEIKIIIDFINNSKRGII